MAEHGAADIGTADGPVDLYPDRQLTYRGFLRLLKYSTIAVVVALVLMAFFLL